MFYSVLSAIYQIIKFGKCYPSQNSHYKQFHRNHGTEIERESHFRLLSSPRQSQLIFSFVEDVPSFLQNHCYPL